MLTLAVASTVTAGNYPVTITGTSGTLTASTSITLTVTAQSTGSFTLKPAASTLSVAQGASGTDTITVTDVSPFSGSVTLTASGLPSGVTASFSPTAATSSSVLTLSVASTVATGSYPITITGTSGTLTATTSIALTVTGTTSGACQVIYTISPQNSTAFGAALTIDNTSTTAWTNWTLTWTFANGQTVSSLWNGVESQSGSTVTVTNQSYNGSVPAGGSVTGIGFNGTWNGVTNAVPTNFAVNGTACGGNSSTGSFSLKASSSTVSAAPGASGTDTITVTDVSPFAGNVTFAASGLPTGVTASFSPASSATSSVLTLSVASSVAAGSYPITITGTSGTLTASTSITLTVTGSGSFSLKASASTLSVAPGASGTDTITVTDVSPFAGSVSFAASGMPSGVTASFSPTSSATSSVLTLSLTSTVAAGTYPITITGTSGS
ncbi:MAG: cellulose binding domain-containing protein, partial [Terracidiphilus sp.]